MVGADTVVAAAEQRVEHADVAAAVRTLAHRDGDVLGRRPVAAQPQFGGGALLRGGHAAHRGRLVFAGGGVGELGDVEFQAAPAAGDRDPVALPRRVGHQVVGELGARRVAHHHRHVVLDGDAGTEDVQVAPVAVLVLGVQVQPGQVRAVAHVQRERVVLGRGVAVAALVVGGQAVAAAALVAVEEQVAPGEDLGGARADPPVDQVEVVAGLVHQQAAGVALVAVPAAEVVRAVAQVEQPLEVHRSDLPDDARAQQVAQLAVDGVVPVVEADGDPAAGALLGGVDAAAALQVGGHRLLGDDVAARLQGGHDVVGVQPVDGAHDDLVDRLGVEHPDEVVGGVGGHGIVPGVGDDPVVDGHAGAVGVAQGDQAAPVGVRGDQGTGVHPGTRSGAHDRVAAWSGGVRCWVWSTLIHTQHGKRFPKFCAGVVSENARTRALRTGVPLAVGGPTFLVRDTAYPACGRPFPPRPRGLPAGADGSVGFSF